VRECALEREKKEKKMEDIETEYFSYWETKMFFENEEFGR
jgi:hypothetical protein